MSAITQWEIEKLDLAERLYVALAALVGDVEQLPLTDASLSWRTPDGRQGHWRVERGQLWLGRMVWTDEGRQNAQLVLTLDSYGEDEEHVGLAHPTAYHCRNADAPPVGCDPDTPAIYTAALALLTQLGDELRVMLPHLGPRQAEPMP